MSAPTKQARGLSQVCTLGALVEAVSRAKAAEEAVDWRGPGDRSDIEAWEARKAAEDSLIEALGMQGISTADARAMVWAIPDCVQ